MPICKSGMCFFAASLAAAVTFLMKSDIDDILKLSHSASPGLSTR